MKRYRQGRHYGGDGMIKALIPLACLTVTGMLFAKAIWLNEFTSWVQVAIAIGIWSWIILDYVREVLKYKKEA